MKEIFDCGCVIYCVPGCNSVLSVDMKYDITNEYITLLVSDIAYSYNI